jgi:hypothetical protein
MNSISLGKTTEMVGEKVDHCCTWSQEGKLIGIAESLVYSEAIEGSSGRAKKDKLKSWYTEVQASNRFWLA